MTTPTGGHAADAAGLENPEALARIFGKLRRLETSQVRRVGIVQMGASHTAAHLFTDAVRQRLTARFGDGGRGFVAVGRHSERLTASDVHRNLTGHWRISDAMEVTRTGEVWGLTGVRAEGAPGATFEVTFCRGCAESTETSRLELLYHARPDTGRLEVSVDGAVTATIDPPPAGTPAIPRVHRVVATGLRHTMRVRNLGPGPAVLFGVSAERSAGGLVYDALGLPGSTAATLARYDQEALTSQLETRHADLYVLFYGTNESALPLSELETMRHAYRTVFRTLRTANPDADCLFLGPTDRMLPSPDGVWHVAGHQSAVIATLREVAREQSCAFWSSRAAMGGPGSIERWRGETPPLALADHVHLTPAGYTRLAEQFVADLLGAYDVGVPAAAGRPPFP